MGLSRRGQESGKRDHGEGARAAVSQHRRAVADRGGPAEARCLRSGAIQRGSWCTTSRPPAFTHSSGPGLGAPRWGAKVAEATTSTLGISECRSAIESACAAVGVEFPSTLLDQYEGRALAKFQAHSWTWDSRRALVLLSARWVGRLAGELALRDRRRIVTSSDSELAFTIARAVCYARSPLDAPRLDWCPDGPPVTGVSCSTNTDRRQSADLAHSERTRPCPARDSSV